MSYLKYISPNANVDVCKIESKEYMKPIVTQPIFKNINPEPENVILDITLYDEDGHVQKAGLYGCEEKRKSNDEVH